MMLDNINILYVVLFVLGCIILYILSTGFQPKTLIHIGKPGKPQKRIGHLGYEDEHIAGEIRLYGGESGKPIARTAFHDKEDAVIIRILHGDVDSDDNLSDYRMKGFISSDGYIYKQFNSKEAPVRIGYTAKPSKPNVPTTIGERRWYELWLKSTLAGYLGEPGSEKSAPNKEVTRCYLDGIAFKRFGNISSEAKACAFAMFYGLYCKKERDDSYYQEANYSGDDVNLAASLIFSLLFIAIYLTATQVFKTDLIGADFRIALGFCGLYFLIHKLLYKYKIYTIEEGHSIQPQLLLINKGIGIKKHDTVIKILSILGIVVSILQMNFDFTPILFATFMGFYNNGKSKGNFKPWKIVASYQEENYELEDEDADFANTTPPAGDIPKHYTWDLDSTSGTKLQGVLTVNFDNDYMTLLREENPYYAQTPKTSKQQIISQMADIATADQKHSERISYIAKYIKSLCKQEHISELDQLQFTLDFVQEPNIEFNLTKDSKSIQYASDYLRLPDETLLDQEGDYGCKALLAALLLRLQGYDTIFVASTMKQHAGVAVKIDSNSWTNRLYDWREYPSNNIIEYNNHQYLYCETSGDGYKIGQLPTDLRQDDFDVKVEMPVEANEETEEEFTI